MSSLPNIASQDLRRDSNYNEDLKNYMLGRNKEREGNEVYQRVGRQDLYYAPYSYFQTRSLLLQRLSRKFIEEHTVELTSLPLNWNVVENDSYFGLKLKMCQISHFLFDFKFGMPTGQSIVPQLPSVVEQPHKCLKIDISLNDLQELTFEGLQPFQQLRYLDASLNRIENYQGVELCNELVYLNLSHNFIKNMSHINSLYNIIELNLSMNEITDISLMPALGNLAILHLNNNRLTTLEGIQSLSRLSELHIHKNKLKDIAPLSTSFQLRVLNASDNDIWNLHDTLVVLQSLSRLQILHLQLNPIHLEKNYLHAIKQLTTASVLDNVPLRNDPTLFENDHPFVTNLQRDNLGGLRIATEGAFQDHIERYKRRTTNYINQLQQRIRELQEDFLTYEQRMILNKDEVFRYLDTLVINNPEDVPPPRIQSAGERPWGGLSLVDRPPKKKSARIVGIADPDKRLRDTQQVLRNAAARLNAEAESAAEYNRASQRSANNVNQLDSRRPYLSPSEFDDI